MRKLFGTTTGLTLLVCLIGIVSVLLPWFTIPGLREPNVGMFEAAFWSNKQSGFETGVVGYLTAGLFLLALLFVVAMSPFDPVPLWRSLVVAGLAIGILVVLLVFGRNLWHGFPKKEYGAVLAHLAVLALLLLGTFEVRGYIRRRLAASKRVSEWDRPPETRDGSNSPH